MSDWEQLTFFPLLWISLGGLHPKHTSKWTIILFWLNTLYFVLIIILALIEICISYKNNIYYTIESILTIVLYLHILSKYVILYSHKSTLKHLLEKRSAFWKIHDNIENEAKIESQKIMKRANTVVKCYLAYSLSVVTNFLLQPFITGQLPVLLYTPEGSYYFLVFSFILITPAIMASIWGVDTIFYSVTMPVSVQFKLLAYKFENFDFTINDKKKLKMLVDYHNFLIKYCKYINKMSSGIFFTQYLVAIATSCMQLFIASQPEFGLMNKIKCLSYFTMQIIETAIYCYTAEYISETSANVGNAIYRSHWYHSNRDRLKRDSKLVIVRAQKEIVFNGFGLVWINMQTFTRIFRTAMSFYTYLNTMVYND